jgi:sugar-specific transcriptional regulator TrmB
MDIEILRKAGLSGNEIKVYLALMKLGSVTAGAILKKTDIHRAGVYDTLERLMDKGLASYAIRANRKYFEAAHPDNLIEVIEKKEEELEKSKSRIKQILPELDAMRLLSKEPQEVTLFKGNKGIQSVLENMLGAKKVFALGGYSEEAEGIQFCLKYILPRFHKQRVKKGIKIDFIFPKRSIKRGEQLKEMPHTNVRMLDEEFASLTGIQIYNEFVSIILWSKNPIAILIRSKEIADSYKQYFDYLWKNAKPI